MEQFIILGNVLIYFIIKIDTTLLVVQPRAN